MLKLVKVMKDIKNINIRKVLKNSSHDAVITVFILAQKGKMAFKAPFVPRELNLHTEMFLKITRLDENSEMFRKRTEDTLIFPKI